MYEIKFAEQYLFIFRKDLKMHIFNVAFSK